MRGIDHDERTKFEKIDQVIWIFLATSTHVEELNDSLFHSNLAITVSNGTYMIITCQSCLL
jgi:hypothetical protein